MKLSPFRVALLGMLLVIAYQAFIVAGWGGNWTMLFYSGDQYAPPPYLAETMYQYKDSAGFDGQFYLYIAHDPADALGTSKYIDNPVVRWRRILVPALAWVFSFGQQSWVPYSYIGVVWAFTAAGIFGLTLLSQRLGYPPIAGLLFLAIPAVPISLDRMMTDIALVTMLIWIVWAVHAKRWTVLYALLALAPLVRETGLALTAGWMLWQAWNRDWKQAGRAALSAVPFLAWAAFVGAQFGRDGTPWMGAPFSGIVRRLLSADVFPTPTFLHKVASVTEYIGAVGIALSFVVAIWLLVRGERSFLVFAAVIYTLGIALFAKEDMWGEAYSYCRTAGPVSVMLALIGFEQRRWWLALPMTLTLIRVILQYYFVWSVAYMSFKGWILASLATATP